MRKQFLFTLILMLCLSGIVRATSNVTIHVTEAGKLWEQLDEMGINPREVSNLTVTGSINDVDFQTMGKIMTALQDIDLRGTDITSIPERAFDGKDTLRTFLAPESIETIGSYAFRNCYRLKDIPFGSKIKQIGSYAFYNCYDMK